MLDSFISYSILRSPRKLEKSCLMVQFVCLSVGGIVRMITTKVMDSFALTTSVIISLSCLYRSTLKGSC